jgi:hypothetical protein
MRARIASRSNGFSTDERQGLRQDGTSVQHEDDMPRSFYFKRLGIAMGIVVAIVVVLAILLALPPLMEPRF